MWVEGEIDGNERGGGESGVGIGEKVGGGYGEKVLDKMNVMVVRGVNREG